MLVCPTAVTACIRLNPLNESSIEGADWRPISRLSSLRLEFSAELKLEIRRSKRDGYRGQYYALLKSIKLFLYYQGTNLGLKNNERADETLTIQARLLFAFRTRTHRYTSP